MFVKMIVRSAIVVLVTFFKVWESLKQSWEILGTFFFFFEILERIPEISQKSSEIKFVDFKVK